MKRAGIALAAALPLAAHMVSMSTGEATLEGARLRFELRVPMYEIAHVRSPETALLDAIAFASRGVEARRVSGRCREERSQAAFVCVADYEFPDSVERLAVTSRLHAVTVRNHVHLLRAVRGGAVDQAVMDFSFPSADLRFRPPTASELAMQQFMGGALRAAGGAAPLLFLAALGLAARSRRELLALAASLFLGQTIACVALPMTAWRPAPRFVEAAAALTIAYLAVEILMLPAAGRRWAVVGVLGVFHGLYVALFIETSKYTTGWVLAGVGAAEATIVALLALAGRGMTRALPGAPLAAIGSWLLLAVGGVWFVARLWS
jgi:hypothetical protein